VPVNGHHGALWQTLSTTERLLSKFEYLNRQPLSDTSLPVSILAGRSSTSTMGSMLPPRLTVSRCSYTQATRWLGSRGTGAKGAIGSAPPRRRSARLGAIARGGGRMMSSHHGCRWGATRTKNLMSSSGSWNLEKISRRTTLRARDASPTSG
jgi:hypothetical protein